MPRLSDPYLDKVLPQHKIKAKFMAFLAALLEKLEDANAVLRDIDPSLDLDDAVGKQLDIIGDIVGASRLLDFEPVYGSALLDDEMYRLIIRAKISLNHWDGTNQGIQNAWNIVKNGYRLDVDDLQDMTMLLRVYGLESLFESEFISKGYLAPKPEGVRVNYEFRLERDLDAELYIGGKVVNTHVAFDLTHRREAKFPDFEGTLYAGGRISMYTAFNLPSAPNIERSWSFV